MNRSFEILRETAARAAEWLEMSNNPAGMLAGILAQEIANRDEYIEYLKKRLEHERINSRDAGLVGVEKDENYGHGRLGRVGNESMENSGAAISG